LLGYYTSIALLMLFYWIVPEYQHDLVYGAAFLMMGIVMLAFVIGGFLYIPWMDARMREPEDAYYHFGALLLGRKNINMKLIGAHFKSLALRAYFIPVMMAYFYSNTTSMMEGHESFVSDFIAGLEHAPGIAIVKFILIAYVFLAAMDVLFATIGYLLTFRFLDSHIRSTEPTFFGWFICITCYFPFFELIMINMFFEGLYHGPKWNHWLVNMPYLAAAWGVLVVSAQCLESLTTLTFGVRFSNLTYRGLITAGPFRFTKHPQYIAKMLNRFFFLMPFLSMGGILGAAQNMIMFTAVCLIYFLRARTEENHLARYPEYVEYARWIEQNGVFRRIGDYLPFVKFDEKRALTNRLF
jgi:protein-S-isoprenylcysteine O-methyltransferase Ste14